MWNILVQDGQVASVNTYADVAEWQSAGHALWQVVVQSHFTKLHEARIVLVSRVDDIPLVVEVVALCRDGGLIRNS